VEDAKHVTGSSLRRAGSVLCLIGAGSEHLGGSVYARTEGLTNQPVPQFDPHKALAAYRACHECVKAGLILSAHDVSEGGLAVTLAEMAFSMTAGVYALLPSASDLIAQLFDETPGRFVIEVAKENLKDVEAAFRALPLAHVAHTTDTHRRLQVATGSGELVLDEDLAELKALWKGGLAKWY
jgi:phosphoribosylformylglycinamidine synthase